MKHITAPDKMESSDWNPFACSLQQDNELVHVTQPIRLPIIPLHCVMCCCPTNQASNHPTPLCHVLLPNQPGFQSSHSIVSCVVAQPTRLPIIPLHCVMCCCPTNQASNHPTPLCHVLLPNQPGFQSFHSIVPCIVAQPTTLPIIPLHCVMCCCPTNQASNRPTPLCHVLSNQSGFQSSHSIMSCVVAQPIRLPIIPLHCVMCCCPTNQASNHPTPLCHVLLPNQSGFQSFHSIVSCVVAQPIRLPIIPLHCVMCCCPTNQASNHPTPLCHVVLPNQPGFQSSHSTVSCVVAQPVRLPIVPLHCVKCCCPTNQASNHPTPLCHVLLPNQSGFQSSHSIVSCAVAQPIRLLIIPLHRVMCCCPTNQVSNHPTPLCHVLLPNQSGFKSFHSIVSCVVAQPIRLPIIPLHCVMCCCPTNQASNHPTPLCHVLLPNQQIRLPIIPLHCDMCCCPTNQSGFQSSHSIVSCVVAQPIRLPIIPLYCVMCCCPTNQASNHPTPLCHVLLPNQSSFQSSHSIMSCAVAQPIMLPIIPLHFVMCCCVGSMGIYGEADSFFDVGHYQQKGIHTLFAPCASCSKSIIRFRSHLARKKKKLIVYILKKCDLEI